MKYARFRHLFKPRAAVGLLTALCAGTAAHATDQSRALVLTAYVNAVGSSDLTAGKYADALQQIKSYKHTFAYRSATTDTNLCVAYIAMRNLAAARAACDAAIAAEEAAHVGLSVWSANARTHSNPEITLVYSNRAVLDGLVLDRAAAERDLAKAVQAAPEALFVRRNARAINAAEHSLREVQVQK
jgi:hypothetical protein